MSSFRVVLASGSPRRKEILEQVGVEFEVWPSSVEEVISSNVPQDVCVELCKQKALDVASQIKTYNESHADLTSPQDILVIGADTIVSFDGEILGKPRDEEDAVNMLCKLQGNTHQVFTGVCLVFISKDGRVGETSFFDETDVTFYPVTTERIRSYVESGEPMDKAGSYGIQGYFAKYIKEIKGNYNNVMGFPIGRIINELDKLGVEL